MSQSGFFFKTEKKGSQNARRKKKKKHMTTKEQKSDLDALISPRAHFSGPWGSYGPIGIIVPNGPYRDHIAHGGPSGPLVFRHPSQKNYFREFLKCAL